MHRVQTYDVHRQTELVNNLKQLRALIKERCCQDPVFPHRENGLCSPHLLAYPRTNRLARAAKRANLETGNHYPAVASNLRIPKHITLPFHTPEVYARLEKVL